jgi:hypothetical protein
MGRLVLDLRGRLEVTLSCDAGSAACDGVLTVTTGAGRKLKTVARRAYALAPSHATTVSLPLPGKLTVALRAHPRMLGLRVTVVTGKTLEMRASPVVLTRRRHKKA